MRLGNPFLFQEPYLPKNHLHFARYDPNIAGQDATEAFFGLHRHEVLLRPQYKRLQIGVVADEEEQIKPRAFGALSTVPYAEPTWLNKGFHSPYYKEVGCDVFSFDSKRLKEANSVYLCSLIADFRKNCVRLWMRLSIRTLRYIF